MLALARRRCRLPANSFLRAIQTIPENDSLTGIKNLLNDLEPPAAGSDGYGPPSPPLAKAYKNASPNPWSKKDQKDYSIAKPIYRLYCQSTRNNTITTLVNSVNQPIASFTGGSCGFKKVNRSGYEAGYQCAVHMFRLIEEKAAKQKFQIELFFKGFGQGRDAMHKALLTAEGQEVRRMIVSVTDRTPIKIGGTRAKKMRRL